MSPWRMGVCQFLNKVAGSCQFLIEEMNAVIVLGE